MRVVPLVQNRQKGTLDHRDTLCLKIWGTTGTGSGFGKIRFSNGKFGNTHRICGIYQRRKLSKDPRRYHPVDNPAHPIVAMRSYRPTYSNTEIQQEQRGKIRMAVEYWQGLTDLEKQLYNERGVRLNLSGYNVAVRDFIRYYDQSP